MKLTDNLAVTQRLGFLDDVYHQLVTYSDVLFSTPFIRSLRENFPDSFIAVAVASRCAEVLRLNPDINEIIKFDERSLHRGLLGKLRLVKALKKYNFDICFNVIYFCIANLCT